MTDKGSIEVDATPRPPQGPTHVVSALLGAEGTLYRWNIESVLPAGEPS